VLVETSKAIAAFSIAVAYSASRYQTSLSWDEDSAETPDDKAASSGDSALTPTQHPRPADTA
jgi:hypothetical protein